ncbi:unnamed protein product [Cyprideis torosa]|uniref:Uncharacterized protein n=1 Tax=Cyprideis torosa TaxID=163714 RepID=A0A7R8WAE4_9CRUS|nr:unnamed protein product [Cyprideis torosa]CAG0890900.1 unnamed protein product [Cyprideis torosa]
MAALGRKRFDNKFKFFCGATLISEDAVLTAAHCVKDQQLDIVRLGEHDLSSDNDGANPIDFEVKEVLIHPDYLPPSLQNDIAIVKLSKRVSLTSKVKPACLPSPSTSFPSQAAVTVVGWGALGFGDRSASTLQEVTVPMWINERCQNAYQKLGESFKVIYPNGLPDTVLCAGTEGKDACQGDSGGPLLFRSGTGTRHQKYLLVGVVSGGSQCGLANSPGIYTKVDQFLRWIADTL